MTAPRTNSNGLVSAIAVVTVLAVLVVTVAGWIVLDRLEDSWVATLESTDQGLGRTEMLLDATGNLAGESATGLGAVNGAVGTGSDLTTETVQTVESLQQVLIPLVDDVDEFAATLQTLSNLIEDNDLFALLGVAPSLDTREIEALRVDLAALRADLESLELDSGIVDEVADVSTSIDAVVLELETTQTVLNDLKLGIGDARDTLGQQRDDISTTMLIGRIVLLGLAASLILPQVGLFMLSRRLDGRTIDQATPQLT